MYTHLLFVIPEKICYSDRQNRQGVVTMFQTAFVSGASRGIGRAIATALAREGYHLSLTCEKNSDLLEELAEDLRKTYHIQVLTFTGDMADYDFVQKAAEKTLTQFGQIDVVINNAGISYLGLLHEMTVDAWNRVLSVNLSSCFYTAKCFCPSMIAHQRGHILSVSSMWGTVGASCEVAYSASKGGVHAFTRALAKELAPSGIAVNAIACGVIDTQMNDFLSDEERQALNESIPAGRFAQSSEVADAVIHLLQSPSYLTGQIIGIDGGYL